MSAEEFEVRRPEQGPPALLGGLTRHRLRPLNFPHRPHDPLPHSQPFEVAFRQHSVRPHGKAASSPGSRISTLAER